MVPWLNKHKRIWGLVILVLLLIALIGPWAFDLINVPSEYACSAPFIRLKGDYCGAPVSGMGILPALAGAFIGAVVDLVTGAAPIADFGRQFLVILSMLFLLLPFFSALLLILPGNRRPRPAFHLAAWGLAAVSSLWRLSISPAEWLLSPLWGLWLYTGLASGMLILKVVLAARKRPGPAG